MRPVSRFPCKWCNYVLDDKTDHLYRSASFELAYFTWLYGFRYAEDELRGARGVSYRLVEPSDAWMYVASLALAGVIGGIAYDTFKVLVGSAAKHIRRLRSPDHGNLNERSRVWNKILDVEDEEFLEVLLSLAAARRSHESKIQRRADRKLRKYLNKKLRESVKKANDDD
jgi:hypothetical protein